MAEKTTAKGVDAPTAPPARSFCSLSLLLPGLENRHAVAARSCKMFPGDPCGVAVNTNMPQKLTSWLLDSSVASSYYKIDVLRPPPAFRAPPLIACRRLLRNSLQPTIFWAPGPPRFAAISISNGRRDYCKKVPTPPLCRPPAPPVP